mgnify:CR=1 FL=1
MKYIVEFYSNSILMAVLLSWFIAQALKVLFVLITNRKFDLQRFVGSGGMPSSHSSLVMTLVVMIAKTDGISSSTFAISLAFAVIVMYDAMGVRRAAGEQAKTINMIVEEWLPDSDTLMEDRLKELIGHTPFQVLMGAILGIAIGLVFPV